MMVGDRNDYEKVHELGINKFSAIFTLSASYISLPSKVLKKLTTKL